MSRMLSGLAAHHREGGSGPPGLWQALLSVPAQQSRWQLEVRLSGFGFCASGAGDLSQGLSVSPGAWSLCSAFGKQPAEIGRGEAKRVWISDVEASAAPSPCTHKVPFGKKSSLRAKHLCQPFAPEEISNGPEMKQQNYELPSNLKNRDAIRGSCIGEGPD